MSVHACSTFVNFLEVRTRFSSLRQALTKLRSVKRKEADCFYMFLLFSRKRAEYLFLNVFTLFIANVFLKRQATNFIWLENNLPVLILFFSHGMQKAKLRINPETRTLASWKQVNIRNLVLSYTRSISFRNHFSRFEFFLVTWSVQFLPEPSLAPRRSFIMITSPDFAQWNQT